MFIIFIDFRCRSIRKIESDRFFIKCLKLDVKVIDFNNTCVRRSRQYCCKEKEPHCIVRYSKNTPIKHFFFNREIKGMVFKKSVIQQQQI